MNRLRLLCILVGLLAISTSVAQEPEIEKLRPQIRFSEDFERFPEGSEDTGSAPWGDPFTGYTAESSIQSTVAGEVAASKQLVVTGGGFAWVTPWVPVDQVRLTKVKMTATAVPNADGEFFRNDVSVYVETRHDDEELSPVFALSRDEKLAILPIRGWNLPGVHVPLKPGRQIHHLESLLGTLSSRRFPLPSGPTEVRLIVRFSTGAGTTFAIDDLQLIEEPFEGELDSLFEGYGGYSLNTVPVDWPDPSEENRARPHLDVSIRFESSSLSGNPAIDVASLGDDDIFIVGAPDVPISFVRFEKLASSVVVGHYRIHRPAAGWESLPDGLFVGPRLGGLRAEDGVRFIDRSWISPIAFLPPNVVRYLPITEQAVAQSESFIDLPIRFSAKEPIDIATIGDDDVYVPLGRDKLFASLLGVQAVEDEGKIVDAVFRLERPAFGWPHRLPLHITGRTTPSFARAGDSIVDANGEDAFVSLEPIPHISMTLPPIQQVLSPVDSQFEVEFVYTSESPILLETIGDGDVSLFYSGQPGRFVGATASEDGREVTARFAFDRDMESARNERSIGGGIFGGGTTDAFAFTLGGVRDEAGSTYLGQFSRGRKGNVYFAVPPEKMGVKATFLPRSQFHNGLRSYRFGVRYQSEGAPIREADLELAHFRRIEGVSVTLEIMETIDDGRTVQASYVASLTADEWPDSFKIDLFGGAIRDLEGGSHDSKALVTLGAPSIPGEEVEPSAVQLVGGQLIEGDPDSHRLSFLTNSYISQVDQAVLLFGGRSSMFAAFEESTAPFPSLVGRLVGVADGIATFELDRPEGGWGAWGVNRLPYSLHLGEGNPADGGFLVSGHVTVHSPMNPLPLLFSFEEWVRRLEIQSELPEGSLEGDADGDGVDGLVEYALGSDLQDKGDTASIKPSMISKGDARQIELTFQVRTHTLGLTAEIQRSSDGEHWRSADEAFELVERREVKPGIERLRLCSKEPVPAGTGLGMFRVVIVK